MIDGIPVTSLARTLIDVSATLDERHLSMALDSGLARNQSVDVGMLRRALRRLKTKGRAGTGALGRLLAARAPDAVHLDSALERRFAIALRRAGLPQPRAHHDVVEGGRHLAELDFAYPRERLGIQLHGASIHRRYGVWERDQEQQSELAAVGWLIVPVTWKQLEASETAVMERLGRALARRGV
jgi:very-short-patch-repair endonuclease